MYFFVLQYVIFQIKPNPKGYFFFKSCLHVKTSTVSLLNTLVLRANSLFDTVFFLTRCNPLEVSGELFVKEVSGTLQHLSPPDTEEPLG